MSKAIKLSLAILFFLCLADMPYGYYQLVRLLGLLGFVFLAFQAYRQEKLLQLIIYGALSILFQPFYKIALGRDLWNIVDVLVASGLLISFLFKNKLLNEK
ncbi:hypothetical protein RBH94_08435 [Aestuariibaculum sp. YM273]|uniref:DUF6804 family protein n=1 Tax=Aestuariibaculum sp. YM273 TaxID=3070659 RepID=UPI0027DDFE80|nr:DUF6804 family protein [Aestuariibaculum sp. YM273]WMI64097.1 hypothetical protein RBH94_08435 [Aestuariibaculum sp. YM273]